MGARQPLLLRAGQRSEHESPVGTRLRPRSVLGLVLVALAATALVTRRILVPTSETVVASHSAATTQIASQFDHHFATKTAYWDQSSTRSSLHALRRSLRLQQGVPPRDAAQGADGSVGKMRLIQSQIVTRHGIRFPTEGPIRDVEHLLQKLSPFKQSLPEWMRNYTLQYNQSVEGELAMQGQREMERYAVRMLAAHGRERSRQLYSPDRFQLSNTAVSRTKHSALAFAQKYFSNPQDIHYTERPKTNDTLLRFFDACPRYQKQVKKNKAVLQEMRAFEHSNAIQASLMQLSEALGVQIQPVFITMKDLAAAFSACAFDVALYSIHDQWCSLFNQQMVNALDYYDDLKGFYQLAGGYAINYEMASVLLQDIVRLMDQRVEGVSSLEGAFRFAHAETTLPLMTLLGFGSKSPLKATASAESIATRGFRTSELAPFGANIEFRLYTSRGRRAKDEYFVQVLVNERDNVVIPGCDDVFCPLETLKTQLWKRFLDAYDFHEQCRA